MNAKERYDTVNAEYKEKKAKNAKLREQLIELRRKKGIETPVNDILMNRNVSTSMNNDIRTRRSLAEQQQLTSTLKSELKKIAEDEKKEKKKKEEQKKLEKEQKKKKKEEEKKRKEEEKKKSGK